jgi:hypothetical protein
MSFANLKKNSRTAFENLTKELNKTQYESSDDNLWKPQLDKSGNGYAVIRFLPGLDGKNPYAQIWSHAFQGPGGWYIENSLTTLNQKDPVGELNRQLWNSGSDADKEIARKQKRKLSYYANIYVVSDPANPDNEGKVFLYKFGKKIWDKIVESMQPAFADETPINPFDFWEGADFKLKIRKVDGYWNYDKSEFASASAFLDGDDSKLEKVYNQINNLEELVSPNNFKTYEQLQERLNNVLGTKKVTSRRIDQETDEGEMEFVGNTTEFTPPSTSMSFTQLTSTESTQEEEEDDTLSYFARLAEED